MKRILLILIVLLPAVAWAGPAINFLTTKHDFGNVRQGDQLEFTFEFSNTGTDDLIIEKIHTS